MSKLTQLEQAIAELENRFKTDDGKMKLMSLVPLGAMVKLRKAFEELSKASSGESKIKVLPVIHHFDPETSLEQAFIAKRCGADGIFLISHHNEDAQVLKTAEDIKDLISDFKVGINLLNSTPEYAFKMACLLGLDMIWADDVGVTSQQVSQVGVDLAELSSNNKDVEIFGSVAFKYQAFEPDPEKAAKQVFELGMIPTTSGAATGVAPTVEKIAGMSKATRGSLAVASGMTVDNIAEFAPHLSHVLVATGVSTDEYHFDEELLRLFIEKARLVKDK